MRNLKKILALVLALMMVLSVMVTASATDFADDESITNQEAVTVLSELGILLGKGEDNFDPNGTLTRAEAATLITKIALGAYWSTELAQAIDAVENPFTDVADSHWGIDYILYCASEGIIIGNGKGSFDPSGKLTGYAFGKMLLVAAGAGESGDYLGDATQTWETKVLAGLKKAGFLAGLSDIVLSEEISREDAAQMAFNAMQYSPVIKYGYPVVRTADGKIMDYYDSLIEAATATSILNGTAFGTNIKGAYYYETSKVAYKDDTMLDGWFVYAGASSDVYGRPLVANWISELHGNVAIYTEMDTPVAEYTTVVTGSKVFADMGLSGRLYEAGYYTFDGYIDGKNDVTEAGKIDPDNLGVIMGGTGTLTQVFQTDLYGYEYVVTTINTYVGEVSSWNAANKNALDQDISYEHITVADTNGAPVAGLYNGGYYRTTKYTIADQPTAVKEGTTVTYNKYYSVVGDTAVYRVTNVANATSTAVTVSKVNNNILGGLASFVADGTTYVPAAGYSNNGTPVTYTKNGNNDYTVWFDSYGNVIKTAPVVEVVSNYALVVNSINNTGSWTVDTQSYQVELLLADGTSTVVYTDSASYNLVKTAATLPTLVQYTVDAYGRYIFTTAGHSDDLVTDTTLDIAAGDATMTVGGTATVATAGTVFYIGTTNSDTGVTTWKVVTGIANIPSYAYQAINGLASATETAALCYPSTNVAGAVAILNGKVTNAGVTNDEATYLVYNVAADTIYDATGAYKIYAAYSNGEMSAVKVAASYAPTLFANGTNVVVAGLTYTNGLVTGTVGFSAPFAVLNRDEITAADIALLANGVLYVDGAYRSVSAEVEVYNVTATGIVAGTLTDVYPTARYSTHVIAETVNGIITTIYVEKAYVG